MRIIVVHAHVCECVFIWCTCVNVVHAHVCECVLMWCMRVHVVHVHVCAVACSVVRYICCILARISSCTRWRGQSCCALKQKTSGSKTSTLAHIHTYNAYQTSHIAHYSQNTIHVQPVPLIPRTINGAFSAAATKESMSSCIAGGTSPPPACSALLCEESRCVELLLLLVLLLLLP